MNPRPKPSLTAALHEAAGKPAAVAPAAVDPVTTGNPAQTTAVVPSRAGKRVVSGHFDPAVRRQLRQLALDNEVSVQTLIGETLNDLFAKHGKPRIA